MENLLYLTVALAIGWVVSWVKSQLDEAEVNGNSPVEAETERNDACAVC
jgi:hypothetical protein